MMLLCSRHSFSKVFEIFGVLMNKSVNISLSFQGLM